MQEADIPVHSDPYQTLSKKKPMMMRPHNVPKEATGRTFVSGRIKQDYWVWQHRESYYWVAAGNTGEEETFDEACERARRYIKGEGN